MSATLARLMLVTDRHRTRGRELTGVVAAAVRGGVGIVQVREKDLADDALRALIFEIRASVPPETRLLVNARPRVARTLKIGLHLPAGEPAAERPVARGELLGRSAHDESEALRGAQEGASYVLLGTIFPTESKPGRAGAGIALVERVWRQVHPLPIYAIGGITVSRIPAVIHAGAHGVAVCGAILSDNDPERVAQAMMLALDLASRTEGERGRRRAERTE